MAGDFYAYNGGHDPARGRVIAELKRLEESGDVDSYKDETTYYNIQLGDGVGGIAEVHEVYDASYNRMLVKFEVSLCPENAERLIKFLRELPDEEGWDR